MRPWTILLIVCVCVHVACMDVARGAALTSDTAFADTPRSFLEKPMAELQEAETLDMALLTTDDGPPVANRIRQLPNLTTLKFYDCDLSGMDDRSPVPEKVRVVLISRGKISQSTIRWLAKFPAGSSIVFGCNVRGLEFELGKFTWLTFDNCEISRSAIMKLIEKSTQVTFKEVTLVDDK